MKILIADDETLTRTGLQKSVNWRDLGINEIYTAEDGVEGLKKALLYRPDIVLSDVRMPRMTGIEMMDKIREQLPDSVFVFMSGYSDKEYLKAAIRLQAVNYVEKPLDIAEVEAALRDAAERCRSIHQNHRADSLSASELALYFTMPYAGVQEQLKSLCERYSRRFGGEEIFRSAVSLILQIDERMELSPAFLSELETGLEPILQIHHLHMAAASKKANLFVLHLFRETPFSPRTLTYVTDALSGQLAAVDNYYLAAGTTVSGISHIYDSYSSSVISLQHSFFRAPGSLILPELPAPDPAETSSEKLEASMLDAIRSADSAQIDRLSDELYHYYSENPRMLRRTVQTLYYRLLSALLEQRRLRMLPGAGITSEGDLLLDSLSLCFSYEELHALLVQNLRKYTEDINNYVPENSSVYLIKNYIRKNYADPQLSTKEISEYASLSASYACTVFKNETGQTLNQYLTEYRMERAKELLADPRHNISDISIMVGYNDSNYFGKAFKKYSGSSPSDYRESRLV
ncbi:MAG: response regulator [Eubacteriales bacterium]|nr:response regulator [Eubacteriales bacterium]